MAGQEFARHKQYTYNCRIARGASKDYTLSERQYERLHEAYMRHSSGELTREEFEVWCSGFWAGKDR